MSDFAESMTESTGETVGHLTPESHGSSAPPPDLVDDGAGATAREIAEAIWRDETRLGEVYRLDYENRDPGEIAEALGVSTPSFVYNYRTTAATLIFGSLPGSPSLSIAIARRVRKWLRKDSWSDAARDHFRDLEEKLEAVGENADTRAAEAQKAVSESAAVESKGIPGVYVYTFPHYLRYPYDADSNHTLLKVGQSSIDAEQRVTSQVKGAWVPEEPWLLRVYSSDDPPALEKQLHEVLNAAGHQRPSTRVGGREWFVTSTALLDVVAEMAGATKEYVNEFDITE